MNSYAKKTSVLELIIKGTFYCPAFSHYGKNPVNIACSICNKSDLISAIGYGSQDNQIDSYDFCLECVDKITNSYKLPLNSHQTQNQNHNSGKYLSNSNNFRMFSSNSNNILASNDFTDRNSSWEDQFMSSLNPTLSGMPKNKFNHEEFTNNQNNLNNPKEINYLENFFQPLNPNGFKRK